MVEGSQGVEVFSERVLAGELDQELLPGEPTVDFCLLFGANVEAFPILGQVDSGIAHDVP